MNSIDMQKDRNTKVLLSDKRILFLFILSIVIMSGCSQYQYISFNSYLNQNEEKEFINENDTVLIKYSFAGENFPLTITVYNKLLQPIYFDPDRSAVIVNDYQISGPFYADGQITWIAPLSYATLTSIPLRDQFVKLNPRDSLVKPETRVTDQGIYYLFNEETTPEFFRIILVLTLNEDYSNPTFFDYSFWISNIYQTMNEPGLISYKPSNMTFIRKTTFVGKILGWTGVIALLAISNAIAPVESE